MSDLADEEVREVPGEDAHAFEPDPEPEPEPDPDPNRPPHDKPRPLTRPLGSAEPFPVGALGELLGAAALAIHDRVRAPLAICGQSVLAAATLAVQGHADVELPTGHRRPISNFFISVAGTGERKSTADKDALWPVNQREAVLRESYDQDHREYINSKLAWDKARDAACKTAKGDRAAIKARLEAVGAGPVPPLLPLLVCPEPTYEGLCRLIANGHASLGIFASEGGQFIGGHGMTDDAKLRTAAGLSALWDGDPIKRVRATDGVSILPGRRVAMHLMAQPDIASTLLSDDLLIEQGLLSRFLITAPEAASGKRKWRERTIMIEPELKQYWTRSLETLERRLPLTTGTQNQLDPGILRLSNPARTLWIGFYEHVEARVGNGGELEMIRGLANKLPEHAARLAAVLTLIENIEAAEVSDHEMKLGIELAQHYAGESLRLAGASRVSGPLRQAQQLLAWVQRLDVSTISLVEIYQRGPHSLRDAATARLIANVLVDHGWLEPVKEQRREAFRIVKEH